MKKHLSQKLALVLIIIGGVGASLTKILIIANAVGVYRHVSRCPDIGGVCVGYAQKSTLASNVLLAFSYLFGLILTAGIVVLVYVMAYKNQQK